MATLTTLSSNSFRDISFSSYLDGCDEKFIHKLTNSSSSLSKTEDQQKEDDGEIGVFTADKYFSGGIEDVSPRIVSIAKRKSQQLQRLETDLAQINCNARAGTPSVRSESSRNSQSALLQSLRKNSMQTKATKVNRRSFFASLGCKCADKASVEVDDRVGGTRCLGGERLEMNLDLPQKQCSGSWIQDGISCQDFDKLDVEVNREVRVAFLSSNSPSGISPIKIKHLDEELIPRKSIEVFGSPIHLKKNKSSSLDRKLNVFPREVSPRMKSLEFSVKLGGVNDGNESDASSDLFEIESLTGKVMPYLSRQESEANSGFLSPNNYAPSEASIEWSVVTASTADFSVISDYEELKLPGNSYKNPIKKTFPTLTIAKTRTSKETPRRLPTISLGCRSQKSVSVAGDACRAYDKASVDSRSRRMSEHNTAAARFQAERKLPAFTAFPLPRTHSPRSSHDLYLQ